MIFIYVSALSLDRFVFKKEKMMKAWALLAALVFLPLSNATAEDRMSFKEEQVVPSQKVGDVVAEPCCEIVEIVGDGSLVVAKNRKTGQTFRFKVDNRRYLHSLQVGQEVVVGPDGSVSVPSAQAAAVSGYDRDDTGRNSYVAIFGGMNFSAGFRSNDLTFMGVQGTGSNLSSDPGFIGGLKVGSYFGNSPFGVEAESYYSQLSVPTQTGVISGPGGSVSAVWNGGTGHVWTAAGNLLLRYPGTQIQPYVGVGGAFVYYWDSFRSATAPGLNLLGGVRAKITDDISLFGEFKYLYSRLTLGNLGVAGLSARTTLGMPAVVIGVSFNLPS
jgi:hypothetical protein